MARPMEGVAKVSPSQYQPQSVPFTTNKKLKQINFIFVLQQHLISHISHQNQWIFKLLPPFVLMRLCPIRREPRIAKAKCALVVSHPRSSHQTHPTACLVFAYNDTARGHGSLLRPSAARDGPKFARMFPVL